MNCFHIILLILERRFAFERLELVMKIGRIIISAGKTDFRHVFFVLHQELASMPDAYFHEELHVCLAGFQFEIPAEGFFRQIQLGRSFLDGDVAVEIGESEFVYFIDAGIVAGGEIPGESFAGYYGVFLSPGDGVQDLQETDKAGGIVGVVEGEHLVFHGFEGLPVYLQPVGRKGKECLYLAHFGSVPECVAEHVRVEMNNDGFHFAFRGRVVVHDGVGQVRPDQNHMAGFVDVAGFVSDDLQPLASPDQEKFDFRVVVPHAVYLFADVFSYVKRVFRIERDAS